MTITDVAREVAVRATIDVDVQLANWAIDTDNMYLPVVFSIKVGDGAATPVDVSAASGATAEAKQEAVELILEQAIINALAGKTDAATVATTKDTGLQAIYDYDVDTNLAKVVTISWNWAFTGNSDANDTTLGNAANAATVALDYTVTLDQID